MQSIWCLPNGSSTWHQLNGMLYNCHTTGLIVEHILKLYRERWQLPSLLQLQVIQGDGGELSIPKYLTSYSDNCNGSGSISYSSNVFPKKVDVNNSPRLMSVGGSYHIIYLTNTLFNYVWSKEFGLERFTN